MDWPDCPFAQRKAWALSESLQERWPCGPPHFHEPICRLHEQAGFCDCKASDASDELWGMS